MINGTSAGNVVATGSLTIPMMKKVGYRKQTSAAVEAAYSALGAGGLTMIAGGWITDAIGVGIAIDLVMILKGRVTASDVAHGAV